MACRSEHYSSCLRGESPSTRQGVKCIRGGSKNKECVILNSSLLHLTLRQCSHSTPVFTKKKLTRNNQCFPGADEGTSNGGKC